MCINVYMYVNGCVCMGAYMSMCINVSLLKCE